MCSDLIELRKNNWVARRAVETAKILDEICKDVERGERAAEGRGGDRKDNHS